VGGLTAEERRLAVAGENTAALARGRLWRQQAVTALPWLRESRLRAQQRAFPDSRVQVPLGF